MTISGSSVRHHTTQYDALMTGFYLHSRNEPSDNRIGEGESDRGFRLWDNIRMLNEET